MSCSRQCKGSAGSTTLRARNSLQSLVASSVEASTQAIHAERKAVRLVESAIEKGSELMATVIPIGEPVNDAERQAIAHLRDHLPANYLILHNFEIMRDVARPI